MSEQNKCAKLVNNGSYDKAEIVYNDLLIRKQDPFQYMVDMQSKLQKDLASKLSWNKIPEELQTCGEILDFIRLCDGAIDDERRELYTSLGGMSNGEKSASAVWKNWKINHQIMRNKLLLEHIDSDRLEIGFEMVDQLHFIYAQILALKLNAKDIFCLYYLKNAENIRRYEDKY